MYHENFKIIIATAILINISRMWRDDGLDDDDDDESDSDGEHDDDESQFLWRTTILLQ